MEKRKKTAVESGVLILIVAAILVAVNALSALGVYARQDVTKSEKFTLSKGSGNLLRSMKQQLSVDAYVTKGLPSSMRSCATCAVSCRSTRTPAVGSSITRSSSPRTRIREKRRRTQGSSSSRSARQATRTRRRRSPKASWVWSSDTVNSKTSSSSSRRTGPTVWSFGSATRSARSGTRGTTSTTSWGAHRSRRDQDDRGQPHAPQHGQVCDSGDHHAELPLLQLPGRRPEERRQ